MATKEDSSFGLNGDMWKVIVFLTLVSGGGSALSTYVGGQIGTRGEAHAAGRGGVTRDEVREMINDKHDLVDHRLDAIDEKLDDILKKLGD
jgi:hypothetical protein